MMMIVRGEALPFQNMIIVMMVMMIKINADDDNLDDIACFDDNVGHSV